ncbi:hypothetical protein HPB48_018858 [Haemaphysalis longicornis]|uniref:Uncharacterized protein n=1 Tax=Haemaphysalis longicornis TaxID=44386 RepID=A0A9J6FDQ1_HAELO|nr:hypothetical protein HPB48_018858 [Haemaphysalis longicornis]
MNIILISRLNRHSQVMEEWISKYGKVFGFYKGTVPHVVISDADLIKECFIKESAAFYDRPPAILPVKPYTDMLLFLRGKRALVAARGTEHGRRTTFSDCISAALHWEVWAVQKRNSSETTNRH